MSETTGDQRVADADSPHYPRNGLAQFLDEDRWQTMLARPLLREAEPITAHLLVDGVEVPEPFDIGPVAAGEALVAVAQFSEEPHWQLHILTPKVNKNLVFKHRTLGRCSTAQLMATLNTGNFYTEQRQLESWTPDTYSSTWGSNALYDYIVRMLLPQKWREHPPLSSHVRVWPVYQYDPEVPAGFRVARGNGLVLSFYDSAAESAAEAEFRIKLAESVLANVDEEE